jgi:hypothetical protein
MRVCLMQNVGLGFDTSMFVVLVGHPILVKVPLAA